MNWNLKYLCKSEEEFEIKFKEVKELIKKIPTYQGKLNTEEGFKGFTLLTKEIYIKMLRIYQYASLDHTIDMKNMDKQGRIARCENLFNTFSINISFSEPEILTIKKDVILGFIDNNKELEEFRFSILDMHRKAKHVLNKEAESIISKLSPNLSKAHNLYSNLSITDNIPVTVKIDGEKKTINQSNWTSIISNLDKARDRKKVFEALYKPYDEHKNTYAAIYDSVLTANKSMADVRKFDSVLEYYLDANNIPTKVFTNLINVAGKKNQALKKYYRLRKKYLGLTRHNTYDRFLPLAKSKKKFTYEEAKNIYFDSIKDYPKDFQDKAKKVLEDGFVDVMAKDGKRSGAFSSSVVDLHPYIMLNFNGELDDVFTLAHEAGHSIHSLYAQEAQAPMEQEYTIFVAEIASTFNEHILLDYFMKQDSLDKESKIMLLQKSIDNIAATFYRQALFANYEYIANQLKEENKPINNEVLSDIMVKLYKQYLGINIDKEVVKKYVWIYIPHLFYTPFYVYQYATSFAASFKLYENVQNNVDGAFDKYLGILKSGGSQYPIDQAKDAGIDFTKKETYMGVINRMSYLVDELEKLLFS